VVVLLLIGMEDGGCYWVGSKGSMRDGIKILTSLVSLYMLGLVQWSICQKLDRVVASLLRGMMLLLVGPLPRPTVVCAVAGQTAIEEDLDGRREKVIDDKS
jgi:hypothetical protein